jgi:hypothetical protein
MQTPGQRRAWRTAVSALLIDTLDQAGHLTVGVAGTVHSQLR